MDWGIFGQVQALVYVGQAQNLIETNILLESCVKFVEHHMVEDKSWPKVN